MIFNCSIEEVCTHVKFVSYTGKYPNLCSGILTLLIDDVEIKFGHDFFNLDNDTGKYKDNYDKFWYPTDGGEWDVNFKEIPKKYQKYALEIYVVFNDNVEQGCCGGCC